MLISSNALVKKNSKKMTIKSLFVLLISVFLCGCQSPNESIESIEEETIKYIVPTIEQVESTVKYDRIVIFGVDGAGGEFENINTPNFDAIFSSGSINYHGIAQFPTASAENWRSMFFGVTIESHKNIDGIYPTIFKTYKEKHPTATFYSAVNWMTINTDFIEDLPNIDKYTPKLADPYADDDLIDIDVSEHAIQRLNNYNDTITFIHFGSPDYYGHKYGAASEEYKESIKRTDKLIGNIYSAYVEQDLIDSTLFICVSDHGHLDEGGHGGDTEKEKTVMLAVSDQKNNIINGTTGYYITHFFASIVMFALKEVQPDHYEGGVPLNLFKTLENK